MIHADERCRFRHAVTLTHDESQAAPENRSFRIESRSAANHHPEFPSELPMEPPEAPPTAEKSIACRRVKVLPEGESMSGSLDVTLNFVAQRFHDAGHCHQNRNSVTADSLENFRGIQSVQKMHGSAQKRGNENAHELAEDMAQRHKVQKADGMKKPFVLLIFLNLRFEGSEVGLNVHKGEHHSTRFG